MKLQCGYEDDCKVKDCFHCRRFLRLKIDKLTLAEATCIEDFGMCDLEQMQREKHHRKELDLMQDIMRKLMKKIEWD